MFHKEEFWDGRNKDDIGNSHTNWLCKYELLDPLIKHLVKKKRAAALVIGSGTSNFPEHLYDSGIREVVVVDSSWRAVEAVRGRNAGGGRVGLSCVVADVAGQEPPVLKDPSMRFDLVIDKGTLDILLTTEDGWDRACRALSWMYNMMRTPGTMIVTSHSPPQDRIEMLTTVFWHDIDFKMVKATTVEQMVAYNPYREKMESYPYAVAGWEEKQLQKLEMLVKAGISQAHSGADGKDAASVQLPPRPEGELGYAAGQAYIYILEK